jgi:hypothetical protein
MCAEWRNSSRTTNAALGGRDRLETNASRGRRRRGRLYVAPHALGPRNV